jgi:hypothetical protein
MASDDPLAPLRAAIRKRLGAHPTATRRRRLALDLHALAEEQEAIADAEQRERERPPDERLRPRKRAPGPGAPGGDFVRIMRWHSADVSEPRLTLFIGRALLKRWLDSAGEIKRVGIALEDERIVIRPYDARRRHAGPYALGIAKGRAPRINCDGARDIVRRPDGRYAGEVEGAALIVGAPLGTSEEELERAARELLPDYLQGME